MIFLCRSEHFIQFLAFYKLVPPSISALEGRCEFGNMPFLYISGHFAQSLQRKFSFEVDCTLLEWRIGKTWLSV